jgi:hypothetical protein
MVADGREHLRTAVWLGRQDSNLGMAESKSDRSASHINEHFEKSSETVPNPVNMLARFSKWLGGQTTSAREPFARWVYLAQQR